MTHPIERRERVLTEFLRREQRQIARACHELAQAFARGGTLLAFGVGPAETDAAHVAVEFMHPVIVGKRALPALAPPADVGSLLRPGDVALSLAHEAEPGEVRAFRERASSLGALTIALVRDPVEADFCLAVPEDDPHVVQEVHETAYHILWELVHVFFEHPGLLDTSRSGTGEAGGSALACLGPAHGPACVTCGDVAVEAAVVEVRGSTAVIEQDGRREEVAAELVPGLLPGDRVLCHAGVVLERL